ncbi:hypothetical protein [Nocardia cyriacigeorgica]|uniref:hypothetical protein n=1 Tax=Nocardia cyriacigeorgica TaxID=135487 RepID=UPI002455B087|nr:hypothetical protein [Nocardia cyriacigeorgica]
MLLPVRALRFSVAAAAAVALSLGMTACGSDDDSSDSAATSTSVTTSAAAAATTGAESTGEAPTPEALQGVLDSLADPAVPTAEKTKLIVNGEQRTANIDQMNAALAGYGELTFGVTDVTTEGTTATAQVVISSPNGAAPAMPLTWENVDGTWKLSDASGCMLLGFAQAPCVPA